MSREGMGEVHSLRYNNGNRSPRFPFINRNKKGKNSDE